jgi:hypothetical protein
LWLHKQMPLASGLGSSGASSAAGAFVVNELLGRPLTQREVVLSAMEGSAPRRAVLMPTTSRRVSWVASFWCEATRPSILWRCRFRPIFT